jgi:N-acetyl-anhydromuramyl-L-alanine amidase AmpD
MNILKKIITIPFRGYVKKKTNKQQIVLHHTVSGGSAESVAKYWETLKGKIGTCIIIDKKGIPYQLFSSQYFAGHIGKVEKEFNHFHIPYRNCSKYSIGVELIAWGGLKEKNKVLYNAYGKEYKGNDIRFIENSYRGYNYFDAYTKEQIETLKELLLYWGKRYNISLDYNEDMWDISKEALEGKNGIWTHTSFRKDKSDLFPQIELIEMLKMLKHAK